ncbi:MAG: hypothetical protein JWO08_1320 [Verrucomicrobiaceae bacterium]|nr:hypothetical protein [Verrucomicrobiaceae bacterium]
MEWLSNIPVIGPVLHFLVILLEVMLVFNLLILVHEWGHFLAARWRGLKVEKFYIWFGKPIWKKTMNGVEYGMGSIPLGGFVALPQMGPMGGIEGDDANGEKLPAIKPLDKIIVAFAGPLFSFLLACLFAVLVWQIGMPDRRIHTTTIGWVKAGSPGDKAGLKPNDKILAIDGTPVESWDEPVNSVKERIAFSKSPKIAFTVQRPGEAVPRVIESGYDVEAGTLFSRRGLRTVGLIWTEEAKVYDVLKNSAAEAAGLKKDDVITALNGAPLYSHFAVYDVFEGKADATAKLTVQRDGKTFDATITGRSPTKPEKLPEEWKGLAHTGLLFTGVTKEEAIVNPPPGRQIKDAATMMANTFGAVFGSRGDVGIQQMGGPVKIFSTYYQLFTLPSGWKLVLWFSVILNVNLALMNLIPFPVFDGGHIVMGIGEMIRRKSVLPWVIMEKIQMACVIMLLGFFVYVTWFDTFDLVGNGKKKDADPKLKIEDIQYPAK